ncbi:hypothetical protein D9M70_619400 [compost metagenome]
MPVPLIEGLIPDTQQPQFHDRAGALGGLAARGRQYRGGDLVRRLAGGLEAGVLLQQVAQHCRAQAVLGGGEEQRWQVDRVDGGGQLARREAGEGRRQPDEVLQILVAHGITP